MADPYIGEIQIFPILFVPRNWLICDGRQMQIAQFPALYAVIGLTYGGDGRTNFKLPDLRGQAVLGPGATPQDGNQNGTTYVIGQKVGQNQQSVTLTSQNLPSHNHFFQRATTSVISSKTNKPTASTTLGRLAVNAATSPIYEDAGTLGSLDTNFAPEVISTFGGTTTGLAKPHENQQPYLVLTYAICFDGGIYPSRQ